MSVKILQDYNETDIVQSFVLPSRLTKKQQQQAADQLKAARLRVQQTASDNSRLAARLLQLRYRLEDYINSEKYDPRKRFGNFLKAYIETVDKKRREFGHEIHLHESQLSQLISNTREPNESIIIRLELHSNKNIPAEYWFRLLQKEKIHELRHNKQLRNSEKKHVQNKVTVKI